MPCHDNEPTHFEENAGNLHAMLCAITTVLHHQNQLKDILDRVDWAEAGVSYLKFHLWWEAHRLADQQRRLRKAELLRIKQLRDSAVSKLTPEELEAILNDRI